MEIGVLNEILRFIDSEFLVEAPIVVSGQRKVFSARRNGTSDRFVLKVSPHIPVMVARIKREIKILSEIDSQYFPKVHFEYYVTDEILGYFLDKFDPKTEQNRIDAIKKLNIRPFLVTVEEHIEHLRWEDCVERLRDEKTLVVFLLHLFEALQILWGKKIVHRDLKPDNILIRPSFEPVIIDLGIAKNLSEGATNLTHTALRSPCTPQFAAPEQLTDNKTDVNYKSDQFAVGVIVFTVLTNQYPYGSIEQLGFDGVIQNLLSGKVEDFRKHNQTTSSALVDLIGKLLRVQQHQRFRTGEEITEALQRIKGAV